MKPKIANLDHWWHGSVEIAQMRSFGPRIKNGLMVFAYLSAVGFTATMSLGCGGGGDATLTVTPSHVAAGGSVTVAWKTSGFLSTVAWTIVSNPSLSGFPVVFTGNMSGSNTWNVTQNTTFTLSDGEHLHVISKTVAVP